MLYLVGGIDESLIVLFCLNSIDLALGLLTNRDKKTTLLSSKAKIYIVVMVGVLLDKTLGIEKNTITKARSYIILVYTYNEMASILNWLGTDGSFFIPKGFRKYIKKLEKRSEEYNEEE